VYRSKKIEDRLLRDLAELMVLPGVRYVPLTPSIALLSTYLRQVYNLSFFDLHYAAAALSLDGKIVSFDRAYEKVPGLVRLDPGAV
jgi:predicted nucleic acid-binding protein